jgi:hypothetical protein
VSSAGFWPAPVNRCVKQLRLMARARSTECMRKCFAAYWTLVPQLFWLPCLHTGEVLELPCGHGKQLLFSKLGAIGPKSNRLHLDSGYGLLTRTSGCEVAEKEIRLHVWGRSIILVF